MTNGSRTHVFQAVVGDEPLAIVGRLRHVMRVDAFRAEGSIIRLVDGLDHAHGPGTRAHACGWDQLLSVLIRLFMVLGIGALRTKRYTIRLVDSR